ncbi:transcription factor A, mitochondrial-like isoform X2 [Ptychodera flava]|uniref:transcription factor A, mitochondrial-like isoform X2 n=1 Tax=Ptychodera flava TaxID=63121 RepID=UPI00396A9787
MALRVGVLAACFSKQCIVSSNRTVALLQLQALRNVSSSAEYPDKPKRPLSPFLKYLRENREYFESSNPGTGYRKIVEIAGEEWRSMPEDEKKPYEDEFKAAFAQYKEEEKEFLAGLTEEQLDAMKEHLGEKKKSLVKKRLAKRKVKLGRPKRFIPAVGFYIRDKLNEASKEGISNQERKDMFARVSLEWKNVPDYEKQPYIEMSENDRKRYEEEMAVWEERMVEIGEYDVIRESSRKKLKEKIAKEQSEEH